jgi:hypothetical protein
VAGSFQLGALELIFPLLNRIMQAAKSMKNSVEKCAKIKFSMQFGFDSSPSSPPFF